MSTPFAFSRSTMTYVLTGLQSYFKTIKYCCITRQFVLPTVELPSTTASRQVREATVFMCSAIIFITTEAAVTYFTHIHHILFESIFVISFSKASFLI